MARARDERIDIQTASAEQLERLAGLDGELARNLVRFREANGLRAWEDLAAIPGFDGSLVARLKMQASLGDPRATFSDHTGPLTKNGRRGGGDTAGA